MAKTKGQLLSKIDFLFADIQSQYSEIKKSNEIDPVDVTLLQANLASLTKHFEALKIQAETNEIVKVSTDINENKNIFTPPTENKKPVNDSKVVYEEIKEVQANENKFEVTSHQVDIVSNENNNIAKQYTEVDSYVIDNSLAEENFSQNDAIKDEEVAISVKESTYEVENASIDDIPSRPLSINELIKQQKQAGVNTTQQFQTSTTKDKVADLKTAVNLNDKLLFIKDLFNGYSLAYSEAIELLNRFDTFAEADTFLQTNYAIKNSWAEKSQTVDKFYQLLHKKFDL